MKAISKILIAMFGLAFLAFVGYFIYVVMTFGPETSTDVDDYSDILNHKWHEPQLIKYFPVEIPEYATGVRLSYSDYFLQGGAHFQLRLTLPEVEFEKEVAYFSSKKIRKFIGGNTNDHMNIDSNGAPTTIFHTGDGNSKFSDDYTILLLYISPSLDQARALKEEGDFWWNHGDSCGIAYNLKTRTMVYWAESW